MPPETAGAAAATSPPSLSSPYAPFGPSTRRDRLCKVGPSQPPSLGNAQRFSRSSFGTRRGLLNPPVSEGINRSLARIAPLGSRSACQRRTAMTSVGKVTRKRVAFFVASRTSSPRVCDRRASTTLFSQSTSGVGPVRRSGRIIDGRHPVANPSATIPKCCGCRSRIATKKGRTSSGRRAFGSSSLLTSRKLIGPSGRDVPGERSLACFLAHEVVHAMMADAVGAWRHFRLERWQQDGYADYVAKGGAFDSAGSLRGFRAGEVDLDPQRSGLYLRYHLLVATLLDKRGMAVSRRHRRRVDVCPGPLPCARCCKTSAWRSRSSGGAAALSRRGRSSHCRANPARRTRRLGER